MEGFGGISFSGIGNAAKKRRSCSSRRPRSDQQNFSDHHDISSLSSTPPSDSVSKVSSDENTGYDSSSWRKELSLNQCISKASSTDPSEARIGGYFGGIKRCSEGVLAPSKWKGRDTHVKENISGSSISGQSGVVPEGLADEKKPNKVKHKVGGVTRTIHAKSLSIGAYVGRSSSTQSSRSSEAPRTRQKLILLESSDEDLSLPLDNRSGLQGVRSKDLSTSGFNVRKGNSLSGRMPEESVSMKQRGQCEPLRKSKRVPKRRVVNGTLDDSNDDDDEIRYLERLKTSKITAEFGAKYDEDEGGGNRKQRKISRDLKRHEPHGDGEYSVDVGVYGSRSGKDGKRSRSGKTSKDIDYEEDEELVSDDDPETERKKPRMEFIDSLGVSRKEIAVTTRQRAFQTGKDVTSNSGASLIEFPNGLPPAPPRKQKEKLSEVEQQLKKAEAAQKRRMQVEKAAKESEAEAIRRILGQDSSRKKREDKIEKRQEELAQEKAANAMIPASNSVRWVIGPTGTVVTFSNDMGLPSIFEPKPCGYPPPREKCAGLSCMNPYKYRDSKSKLPLCSLQCYKDVHEKIQPISAC